MDLEVAEPIKQCYEWQKSKMGVQLGLWSWKMNYIVTTSICVVQTRWVLFERRDKDTEKKTRDDVEWQNLLTKFAEKSLLKCAENWTLCGVRSCV